MKYQNFNPNDLSRPDAGLFGLPHDEDSAEIIVIPVNWEATVSYRGGTAGGPDAIRKASMQVDLHHHDFPDLWKTGIWLDTFPQELTEIHDKSKSQASRVIRMLEEGISQEQSAELNLLYQQVEQAGDSLNRWVKSRVRHWKDRKKIVGLIGGDHSIPLGFFQYLDETQTEFGILAVDAHMDLREAYEGFRYSHASIFFNALQYKSVKNMVQVGIRDYCHEESARISSLGGKVKVFFDRDLHRQQYEGKSWQMITREIIECLPDKVYISFDIDGLDPTLCPNTGTPVPGGLSYEQAVYLLNELKVSGKEIVGFDLSEVAPGADEWDGNVGSRMLYHLCGVAKRR